MSNFNDLLKTYTKENFLQSPQFIVTKKLHAILYDMKLDFIAKNINDQIVFSADIVIKIVAALEIDVDESFLAIEDLDECLKNFAKAILNLKLTLEIIAPGLFLRYIERNPLKLTYTAASREVSF